MKTESCNESNDAHDVAICILVFMRKVEIPQNVAFVASERTGEITIQFE